MSGAARLCGEAAYRGGAGLVTLATHPDHATTVSIDRPELLAYGVAAAKDLKPLVARATVVAIGPGLSQEAWAQAMFRNALAAKAPLVVDADALNLLAADPHKKDDWVLTPHPGEAARLLNVPTSQVQADRFAAARKIAHKFGGVCVLKGAGTLIASADDLWLCDRGNPGMASGGTGDVLTGLIAALRAQGLAPLDAARLAVWVHAVAGDDAAADGQIGLVASDLFPHIRRRLNLLVSNEHAEHRDG
jgi:NAD(P)H-hydrate epimerase